MEGSLRVIRGALRPRERRRHPIGTYYSNQFTPAEIRAHQEWLGFVQPVGLVVSPAALVNAQPQVDRNIAAEQETLKALVREEEADEGPAPHVWLPDLPAFFTQFLGWEANDLAGGRGGPELPAALDVAVPDYDHDLLSPTYAVPQPEAAGTWLLLIRAEAQGTDLDKPSKDEDDRRWNASPQARFERLLRANDVPIGVLTNRTHVRLVYAPHLESTGHLTFKIADLCTVAGRPLVSALLMLLGARRLFSGPIEHRLPASLRQSRRYQNEVSTELAEQVLAALNALLRGFRAANDVTGGALLADVLREKPDDVYGGLLGTLMRLVFVLYAEDRDLLPGDDVYQKHYSVTTLFEQLRDDVARYPDTMDQRDHRVSVPSRRSRESGRIEGERRKELHWQLCARHGLHVRRHREERRRNPDLIDARADREGS